MAISDEDRKVLLALARETVMATAEGLMPPTPPAPAGGLAITRGCFVTLKNHGVLRGCIGTFNPDKPLPAQIVEMAAAATARDSRFAGNPITPEEVPELTIGISVLSELEPIDDPLNIELGVHGIYVRRGDAGGCYLPEVATETGWSKEELLSHCCGGKARMSPDAWKDPDTTVQTFTTEKFSDGDE